MTELGEWDIGGGRFRRAIARLERLSNEELVALRRGAGGLGEHAMNTLAGGDDDRGAYAVLTTTVLDLCRPLRQALDINRPTPETVEAAGTLALAMLLGLRHAEDGDA